MCIRDSQRAPVGWVLPSTGADSREGDTGTDGAFRHAGDCARPARRLAVFAWIGTTCSRRSATLANAAMSQRGGGRDVPKTHDRPRMVPSSARSVSYTHLRAHETDSYLVCRL